MLQILDILQDIMLIVIDESFAECQENIDKAVELITIVHKVDGILFINVALMHQ